MSRSGKSAVMPEITVRNLQWSVRINVRALQEFAKEALQFCLRIPAKEATPLRRLREIFVILISDRRMARLHRQFLNQSGPTDVITFDHGEIFISVERARDHAGRFGSSLAKELRLYVVHGLLHLHGFDDRKKADARRMQATQQKILAAVA